MSRQRTGPRLGVAKKPSENFAVRPGKVSFGQLAGTVICTEHGSYELRKQIGRGAMASVYLGHNVRTFEKVAIKILDQDLCESFPSVEKRCIRGARAIAPVLHKNIARVYGSGEDSNGLRFVVMEYVNGTDLDSYLSANGPMPWEKVARIGVQLCCALSAAHRQGLVHRDVKPANCLFIPKTEGVKLADFGIARECRVELGDDITAVDKLVGTPSYIAPEVVHASRPTPQMDIYSLGVTLFKLLTGELPFTGDSPEAVLEKKMREVPPRPSAVLQEHHPDLGGSPSPLDEVILNAIARLPRERYQSADEVGHALKRHLPMSPQAVWSEFEDVKTEAFHRPDPNTDSTGEFRRAEHVVGAREEELFENSNELEVARQPELTVESEKSVPSVIVRNTADTFPWARLSIHMLLLVVLVSFFGFAISLLEPAAAATEVKVGQSENAKSVSWPAPQSTESRQDPGTLQPRSPPSVGEAPPAIEAVEDPTHEETPPSRLGGEDELILDEGAGEEASELVPDEGLGEEASENTVPPRPPPSPQASAAEVAVAGKKLRSFASTVVNTCQFHDASMFPGKLASIPRHSKISVRVKIGVGGNVTSVRVGKTKNANLKRCVKSELSKKTFPKSSVGVTVGTTFQF